jgi:hypothetical protein
VLTTYPALQNMTVQRTKCKPCFVGVLRKWQFGNMVLFCQEFRVLNKQAKPLVAHIFVKLPETIEFEGSS